jgi:hypothetical protein
VSVQRDSAPGTGADSSANGRILTLLLLHNSSEEPP